MLASTASCAGLENGSDVQSARGSSRQDRREFHCFPKCADRVPRLSGVSCDHTGILPRFGNNGTTPFRSGYFSGMKSPPAKPAVLIIVENLPVPLDRRVWHEATALREAGYEVVVICPQMKGYTTAAEVLEGIQIYRHKMLPEAKGLLGFFAEYASALWGETILAWKSFFRHRFKVIHMCNPPD